MGLRVTTGLSIIIITGILLGSCTPSGPATSTPTPEMTKPIQPAPYKSDGNYQVSMIVFHDYNGNGKQDSGEPSLAGINLTFQPLSATWTTNSAGKSIVSLPGGDYHVYVSDPSNKFRYILPSAHEVREISEGLEIEVRDDSEVLVPLAEGFLTWPFPLGTRYTRNDYLGRDSLFDRDRRIGFVETYDSSVTNIPSGGVGVVDNHEGIDIGVDTGTKFVAAANLKITGYRRVPGQSGKTVGKILVSYENGYTGEYAHAVLIDGATVGDNILRGDAFGIVEDSDVGAPHLHFQLNRLSEAVDPYDYWTKYCDPQYPSSVSQTFSTELVNVTNIVFHDYNGNGTQDVGEPNIQGVELVYEPGSYKSVTDINGKGVVNIPPGNYKVSVSDPSGRFRYIFPSISEVMAIEAGLGISLTADIALPIALGEGFLTLPFPSSTEETHSRYYVDVDTTKGGVRDWEGNRQTTDNHFGTDFLVPRGTPILAAAPGVVVESIYDEDDGNRVFIEHEDGNLTMYCHLEERTVDTGHIVRRGEKIGVSGNTGRLVGPNPHLHFQFGGFGQDRIDPYRDLMDPVSVSYWTKDNDPQFSLPSLLTYEELTFSLRGQYPELLSEMEKLPEIEDGVSERDLEALNDIYFLVMDQDNEAALEPFRLMLAEGIGDKRKYSTPLQALLWIAYDREFDTENPLQYYSLRKLINDAWKNTTTSADYTSKRWQNLDEVVERLNSPRLVSIYMVDNIAYDYEELENINRHIPPRFASPEDTFLMKKGVCNEQSRFALYSLLNSGYDYDDFETKENAVVMLGIDIDTWEGHDVCLVKEGGVFYAIDNGRFRGPFPNVLAAVDSTAVQNNNVPWRKYFFRDLDLKHTKVVQADDVKRLTQETKGKNIIIDGGIDEWPSDITMVSDPVGDMSRDVKDKRGVDLKALRAFMDEDYLYVAIQIYDVFMPSLLRNYFVALDFDGDKQDEYHFGVRPNGVTWVFDHTRDKNSWKDEDTWGVSATGNQDTIEIRIPRIEYGIPATVWIYCRVTEGGPTVDSTEWFQVP